MIQAADKTKISLGVANLPVDDLMTKKNGMETIYNGHERQPIEMTRLIGADIILRR